MQLQVLCLKCETYTGILTGLTMVLINILIVLAFENMEKNRCGNLTMSTEKV